MNVLFRVMLLLATAVFAALAASVLQAQPASAPSEASPARAPAIERRVPWTTSRIVGSPEPPLPYEVKRVFPKLKFIEPVDICSAPGLDRLFVLEQKGRLFSFQPGRPEIEAADVALDPKALPQISAAYGMTFHPGFATNRYFYLCYVTKDGQPDGTRVSRFRVARSDPPRIEPETETVLLTFLSGGHNGGCLKFGLDGYLYISTGDAAGPNPPDPLNTGQDNTDLLSAILRIDVDRGEGGKPIRIPPDNPFIGMDGVRPEIWAYGFRNPWKIGFDKKTGALWAGDVGWELWELVYRVERGGNYGWSVMEGRQPINPAGKRGPTPILPPTVDHPHSEAASITGGLVYYGEHLRDLSGAYIYGDWVTGKIWGLRHDGSRVTWHRELAGSALQIICFGEDAAGELYVLDYAGGIYQLQPNANAHDPAKFPRKLSETGLFDVTKHHIPAPGVLPFLINAEMWADHALAERFVALPGTSRIETGATNVWLYQSKNEWRYPTNAVLAKTLFLELERGNPRTLRRVETQVLHYDGREWRAYTYRWNDEQTDAELVPASGDEAVFNVKDALASSGERRHTWRFHSRSECLRCHNPWVNYALAFTAQQLNRDVEYQENHPVSASLPAVMKPAPWANDPIRRENQLRTLSHLGYFDQPLDERARPRLTDPYSSERGSDLTERARSWLHVNCAHCHREGAGGSVVSHFDYDTKLKDAKAVGFPPSQGAFGIQHASVITPGDPTRSVLYYRISKLGQGRMPHIGSSEVDIRGVNLMADWIKQLPKDLAKDWTENSDAARLQVENEKLVRQLWSAAGSLAQQDEILARLLSSTSGALALLDFLNRRPLDPIAVRVVEQGASHANPLIRDLFERFLPEERRTKKLGSVVAPEMILALKGDPARGRRLFFLEGGAQCYQCHRVAGEGRDFGPDLSAVGRKYDRAQLLEHLLAPSKTIDPAFALWQVETKDDLSYSGFLVERTAEELVLKDATLQQIRIRSPAVLSAKRSNLSVMPEGLLQNMTAQEAADLLEFLSSLR